MDKVSWKTIGVVFGIVGIYLALRFVCINIYHDGFKEGKHKGWNQGIQQCYENMKVADD